MAITTYPLNNIKYDAEDAELFHCTRRSGVFMGSSGNTEYSDFDATVTGSNRVITIQPGLAWIRNGRFKGKVVCVDVSVSLTLTASNAKYPRYDAIVLRFNPSIGASQLISVQGTASSNPSRPTPVRAENGTYDLHLYHVYRPAGSSVVTSSNVEDMRADLNYCGYMVDDVSAFDEGKFLARENYDPTESVAKAGGIAKYVQDNSSKVTVSTSLTSTSTTTAASSSAVKSAYDRAGTALTTANNAIQKSQRGASGGVAPLNSVGKIDERYLPTLDNGVVIEIGNVSSDDTSVPSGTFSSIDSAYSNGNFRIMLKTDKELLYFVRYAYSGFEFFGNVTGYHTLKIFEDDTCEFESLF